MVINQHNFDWSITNRDVILFIPNFKRKHLLIPTLMQMETALPKDQWLILVANDGPHEDLSDLARFNLAYFTFERTPATERNGCLIRNYVLQRLQSRVVGTRDPEIFIKGGDYLSSIANMGDAIYRPCSMVELQEPMTPKILADPMMDVTELPVRATHRLRTPDEPRAFHAGVAALVERFKQLGGYDEEFAECYGYEDIDMLRRLIGSGIDTIVDPKVQTFHLWHPRKAKFLKTVRHNGLIYDSKKRKNNPTANEGKNWGKGI
ncbi:hypothetical protein LCGC14_1740620 [marine sediment metagenome]|uniref:Galactosyltransferase C-terminal domain-containing protein n=1 Tax=marine sediment metagenome TaxID=412755 RepID=A0A0F9H6X4_9ZZZZ